ncbi:MAG: flavodoxin domain-containing protein [Coriobacteriales bacterium]
MKAAILYCSQTGFTKKYAEWLAAELNCAALPFQQRQQLDLDELELLVFCSWFHAASIKGSKWLKELMAQRPGLKVVVLVTGASAMPGERFSRDGEVEEAFRRSFPAQEYPDLPWFYCRGGFDFSGLGAADKLAMRMFFRMNGKKAEDDPDLAEMLEEMERGFDGTKRAYLEPVLACIRQL